MPYDVVPEIRRRQDEIIKKEMRNGRQGKERQGQERGSEEGEADPSGKAEAEEGEGQVEPKNKVA
jgi:hypothetical protein